MKRFLLFIHIILITNVLAYSQDSFRLISSERIPVDSRYDDEVNKSDKRFLALYKSRMDRQLNTMVANADSPIEADDPAGALNYFCADLMLKQIREVWQEPIDFSLVNNHAFRKALPEGPITLADVYETLPFENEIVILQLKGSDVKRLFNTIARRQTESFSGAQIKVKDNNLASLLIGGKPLDEARVYTLVTIDYLAEGSGGMTPLKKAVERYYTKIFLRDIIVKEMEAYSRRGKLLSPAIDNRFEILP